MCRHFRRAPLPACQYSRSPNLAHRPTGPSVWFIPLHEKCSSGGIGRNARSTTRLAAKTSATNTRCARSGPSIIRPIMISTTGAAQNANRSMSVPAIHMTAVTPTSRQTWRGLSRAWRKSSSPAQGSRTNSGPNVFSQPNVTICQSLRSHQVRIVSLYA